MVAVGIAAGKVTRIMGASFRRLAVSGLRIATGAIFAYAGLTKIHAAATFAENIATFRLLPPAFDNLFALGLPPFEILLGLGLIAGWRKRTAAFCTMLLGGVFLLALVSAWSRGIPADCGCFGSTGESLPLPKQQLWLSIGRDLLLLTAAAVVYLDACKNDSPPSIL